MTRMVVVVPYDPVWPAAYEAEANQISSGLGSIITAIHHMGSTSVPGMVAKPTIDILLVDRDHAELDANQHVLQDLGYQSMGEYGLPGRRYFRKLQGEVHLFHIHAYEEGHPDIARHLNFCDYLRNHPEEAGRYQALKLLLAAQFPFSVDKYTSGKTDYIKAVEKLAAVWSAQAANAKESK